MDSKLIYWFVIFSLLLIPAFNGFCKSINSLVKSNISSYEYRQIVSGLEDNNKILKSQIKYYKSDKGLKTIVKERLNKVEEGEILIKFDK